MAIDANSYGSTDGVAALTPRYANASGVFDATTRPILTTVEGLIDQLSGILNTMLAEQGFTIPISQTTCKLALDMFVNEEAAAVVEGINGSGRFGPTVKVPNKGRFMLIMDDVQGFIAANAAGFERLGATRAFKFTDGIAFRDSDEAGDETFPIFERKSFGGETFIDTDT